MYTRNVVLENKNQVPHALSNEFDNSVELLDSIEKCNSAIELARVASKLHAYHYQWKVDKDCDDYTRISYSDVLGNVHYLRVTKEVKSSTSTGEMGVWLLQAPYHMINAVAFARSADEAIDKVSRRTGVNRREFKAQEFTENMYNGCILF